MKQQRAVPQEPLLVDRAATVQGQRAVFESGLEGVVEVPPLIPWDRARLATVQPDAEGNFTFQIGPIQLMPIACGHGRRLTWNTRDPRSELLSNVAEAEPLRIAASLVEDVEQLPGR